MSDAGKYTEAKMVLGNHRKRTLHITPAENAPSVVSEVVDGVDTAPHDAEKLQHLWLEPFFNQLLPKAMSTARLIPMLKMEQEDPAKLAMRLTYMKMGLSLP